MIVTVQALNVTDQVAVRDLRNHGVVHSECGNLRVVLPRLEQ
jgi:hypothetical protein